MKKKNICEHVTGKFGDRVRHLNIILACGGRDLKDPISKVKMSGVCPQGRGS